MTAAFDRRVTPARSDLAAAHLRGLVESAAFVEPHTRTVVPPSAPVRREPHPECRLDTEALRGESVQVYESTVEGWSWVQLDRDGYCGYLASEALGAQETPTHQVAALRTFVFPGPDIKAPVLAALTLGARLKVSDLADGFARIGEGFVWAGHLAGVEEHAADFVAVAERFVGVPYLWGGKTSLGLDCSGLVQVALHATGFIAPRDSDMQADGLGQALPTSAQLRRGDLVFWPGHVGLMRDGTELLHANAHAMMVTSEPLAVARQRIAAKTGVDLTVVRRI